MNWFPFFLRRRNRPSGNPLGSVRFDDARIVFTRPDGATDYTSWSALTEVGVLTTDDGPLQEDVFYMILSATPGEGCAIPQGADGTDQLLQRLQQRPGFDHDTLIRAMGCTGNDRFVCWKRP